MASFQTYLGNGSTTDFTVPFPYLDRLHVSVTVDAVTATFTWLNSSLVRLSAAPANGAVVRVQRTTPASPPAVQWNNNSAITAENLQTDTAQTLYVAEEAKELQGGVIRAPLSDPSGIDYTLPSVAARASRVMAFTPTGAPTTISAAFLAPGATSPTGLPVVALDSFVSVIGDGVTDDAAAIEAALAFIGSGEVWFGKKTYRVSRAVVLSKINTMTLRGVGEYAGGTQILMAGAAPEAFDIRGCAHVSIEGMWLRGQANSISVTSGYAVRFRQATDATYCFDVGIDKVRIDYAFNGIRITGTADCNVGKVRMRYLMGTRGLHVGGDATYGVYGTTVERFDADNPTARAYPALSRVFGSPAAARAQALGDILLSSGRLYQCTTAGTSALAGGPTGTVISATSTDGTCVWTLVGNSMEWLCQDTNAYSIRVKGCALINGMVAVSMRNSASGAIPQWLTMDFLETDHPYLAGVLLEYGQGCYGNQWWIGSTLTGNGVTEQATFKGEVQVSIVRILGNAQNGWFHATGPKNINILGGIIAHNSAASPGAAHGFATAAGATDWMVTNIQGGDVLGIGGSNQGYTVFISATNDRYTVSNIQSPGELFGAVTGTTAGTTKNLGTWLPNGQPDRFLATIPSGSTSVVVNHDCGVAPANCMLSPRLDPGAGTRWWTSNFTATTVQVNISQTLGYNMVFDVHALPQPLP